MFFFAILDVLSTWILYALTRTSTCGAIFLPDPLGWQMVWRRSSETFFLMTYAR